MNSFFSLLLKRFTPFKSWIWELKNKEVLKADIIAWITVALVLIPQSMAYAQLAGLPVHIGLYASFLPVMVAAFFWSSRQLATWPVAIVSLMTAIALEPIATANPEWFIVYAALLSLLVWIFQLSLWLLKLWVVVNFLSHPVVVWFTNAWALIIASSQLNKVFWVKAWVWEHQYEVVWGTIQNAINWTNLTTLIIAICSILVLIIVKKINKKLPWVLIAVTVFTIVSYYIWYENIWWAKSIIWEIPKWLPGFKLPPFELEQIKALMSTAVVISLVWFMEAISIAKWMASQDKKSISANQELVWQWLSNIVWSFFQWYPVSWSFSRSAVNFSSGAKTWFSSVVTWIIAAIALLFLTPLLYHLPQATLAAVIIMAVVNLIKIEPIIHAFKVQKHDWIVSIITFFVTLYFAPKLEEWIIVWVILSIWLFIYRTSKPNFAELSLHKSWDLRWAKVFWLKTSKNVWMYRFDWPLYFWNAGYFEWKMLKFVWEKPDMKVIILDFEPVQEIDATWIEVIDNIIEKFWQSWLEVYITRIRKAHYEMLEKTGFFEHFSKDKVFFKREEALEHAKEKFWDKLDLENFYKYIPLKKS